MTWRRHKAFSEEVRRREIGRRQLHAFLDGNKIENSRLFVLRPDIDGMADGLVMQVLEICKNKEAPFIFEVKGMKGALCSAVMLDILIKINLRASVDEFPWKLNWWYRVPGNTGSGPFLFCFDYPDILHLRE